LNINKKIYKKVSNNKNQYDEKNKRKIIRNELLIGMNVKFETSFEIKK